jgi:LCP family protein required for cell wall assembly
MADERPPRESGQDRPYTVYRGDQPRRQAGGSGPAGGPGGSGTGDRPYTTYKSGPRGLRERLRGEDTLAAAGGPGGDGRGGGPGDGRRFRWRRRGGGLTPRRGITPRRVLKWLALAIVAWLLLSFGLFMVSASTQSGGSLPASATNALASGSNMITGTDTVLVLGTDQRPKGTHEAGANTSDRGSRSDTIMLWRIGGGVSRRLSIPRDTVAHIPGYGSTKINAAYAYGGPALAIRTIEAFTGVTINHLIVINLANFPKFIDAVGGIDVTTGRICSNISGGAKNGGFSLFLRPGTHTLTGIQALTLARTRENACNAASNDLTRAGYQQKILNGIKSKLLSPGAFFHLPWASWYAPGTVRTDMGGFGLLSLFVAAEMGGSAPTQILKPTGSETLPDGESALVTSPSDVGRAVSRLMNG